MNVNATGDLPQVQRMKGRFVMVPLHSGFLDKNCLTAKAGEAPRKQVRENVFL